MKRNEPAVQTPREKMVGRSTSAVSTSHVGTGHNPKPSRSGGQGVRFRGDTNEAVHTHEPPKPKTANPPNLAQKPKTESGPPKLVVRRTATSQQQAPKSARPATYTRMGA